MGTDFILFYFLICVIHWSYYIGLYFICYFEIKNIKLSVNGSIYKKMVSIEPFGRVIIMGYKLILSLYCLNACFNKIELFVHYYAILQWLGLVGKWFLVNHMITVMVKLWSIVLNKTFHCVGWTSPSIWWVASKTMGTWANTNCSSAF